MKPQNLLTGLPIRESGGRDMSHAEPLVRIPVGVVIERRKAKSAWADFVWRPVAVLPARPGGRAVDCTERDADCMNFYAGAAEIELHRSDACGYRDNLGDGYALCYGLRCGRRVPSRPMRSLR